ncbi:unnamed protein product [Brassica oleracea var. botrytis]|uniref:FAS1 domain-containing protein n=1 Tax=Brassica oleracea var. oleracea TaxID=109376 RepID=A0A0D3AKQ5_BRAOL
MDHSVFFLLLLLTAIPGTLSQLAAARAPPGPTNLNNSDNIITIFAPSDSSFSSLKAGTLNTLTDEQQVELVQFHVIPSYVSSSNFQTISNPLRTQAGDSAEAHFPLNITTSGNTVNITSSVTNTIRP